MPAFPEKRITFSSGELQLEGLLARSEGDRGVVISHPHPLYGGEMRNPVVEILQEVFAGRGWTTLRFNFRGTGRSQGEYDEGVGEQEDVRSAGRYLQDLGIREIFLAGYSFGAWVNARAALDMPEAAGSVLVAPPQAMMDFSFLKEDTKTRVVIAGAEDAFGPVEQIKRVMAPMKAPPPLKVIPGADHFFSGSLGDLKQALVDFLD